MFWYYIFFYEYYKIIKIRQSINFDYELEMNSYEFIK